MKQHYHAAYQKSAIIAANMKNSACAIRVIISSAVIPFNVKYCAHYRVFDSFAKRLYYAFIKPDTKEGH